jgi:hypothetical protein
LQSVRLRHRSCSLEFVELLGSTTARCRSSRVSSDDHPGLNPYDHTGSCAQRDIAALAGFEMLIREIPEYLKFVDMTDRAHTLQSDMSKVRALLHPK